MRKTKSSATPSANPFTLALCLALGGISFGISLGWGWLMLLGLLGPIVVLLWAVLAPLLRT